MAGSPRNKEIQVQRPAQSLEHFQKTLQRPEASTSTLLRTVVLTFVGLVVVAGGVLVYRARAAQAVERHEAEVAALVHEVEGDGPTPPTPEEQQKRMRERLGRLEALVKSAPGDRKVVTEGLLANWKLALDGQGQGPVTTDPWGRIRQAQKAIALGKATEARAALDPLRGDATLRAPWGEAFWQAQLETDRLAQDRPQALKDVAEYKSRFQAKADPQIERMLQGI